MTLLRPTSPQLLRTVLILVWVLFVGFAAPSDTRAADGGDLEQRIKAAYLYNFTKFIEWPADAADDSERPFTLAHIGPLDFEAALAPLQQKPVQGRTLRVIRLDSGAPLAAVDLLFVTLREPEAIRQVVSSVGTQATLTIGDAPAFIQNGGLINFYKAGKKIRFEINAEAARKKGFKISSQLLKLARIVDVEGRAP